MSHHPLDLRVTVTYSGAEMDIHPSELDDYLAQGWSVVTDEVKAARGSVA